MTAQGADIENRFGYHPATPITGPVHDEIRSRFRATAHYLDGLLPPGRHKALALTALQEAMMWANAAIACDTPPPVPVSTEPGCQHPRCILDHPHAGPACVPLDR